MSRMPAASAQSQASSPAVGPAPADTRARIAAAAFELFADKGYDSTTVDAIAERAGIARRTFFRYFRSKDDVIFPDHDSLLTTVTEQLLSQTSVNPVEAVCSGVRIVFRSYVDDPQVSVQRYRLTRSVTPLRDRELASVQRYERTFSKYVRERLAEEFKPADAALRADVVAATVVAAHNAVLREWLRAGGDYDPMNDLEGAFRWVTSTFQPTLGALSKIGDGEKPASPVPSAGSDDVVVAVFRADQPLTDVVERVRKSL